MAAVIALRPETDRGDAILNELERLREIEPEHVVDDGTRRCYLSAHDADVDAFDSTLDSIDPLWRTT